MKDKENRKKVLFVYCYAHATQGKLKNVGGSHPPIGLLYPAAVLEKEGYEVRISDEIVNDDTEKIIQEFKPEVLCLSINTPSVPKARSLVEFGKTNSVSLFIAGGAHATNEPESCINDVGVDIAVISEGEIVLPNILKSDDLMNVKGIVYKNSRGEIIKNEKESIISNLDALPFPARHLIDFSKYAGTAELGLFLKKDEKWTPVFSSRGCPFLCTFCANWRVMGRQTRDRSPENVIEELKEIKYKHGINRVTFDDDTFTLRPKRIEKLCHLMIQENLNLKWSCQTRVDTSRELLILMKSAGCEFVAFGVESGSQKVLNTIKKGTTVTKIKEAFKICKEIGMRTKAFLIVGLPGEEREDFEMSVKLVKEINPDYLWVSKFSPVPGSEYYEEHKEELKDMKWTDYSYFYGKVSDEIEKRHKRIVRSFYLRPTYISNFLKRFSWLEFVYMIRMFNTFTKM